MEDTARRRGKPWNPITPAQLEAQAQKFIGMPVHLRNKLGVMFEVGRVSTACVEDGRIIGTIINTETKVSKRVILQARIAPRR
jgi:hypothetical protein